jgi:hypothetical protein
VGGIDDGVAVGVLEGLKVGSPVGVVVGSDDGVAVGVLEGLKIGSPVGVVVGTDDGAAVGVLEGLKGASPVEVVVWSALRNAEYSTVFTVCTYVMIKLILRV